ncbi:MAG: hypothetical protein ABL982_10685 [Vicinamibacterales bacterium]
MTTEQAAHAWGTTAESVERWANLQMLDARRTPYGWQLSRDARPPYRYGSAMILRWMSTNVAQASAFE